MVSITELREMCRAHEFSAALRAIGEMESVGQAAPEVLALKAICIQLGPEEQELGLTDAVSALKAGLELDAESVDILVELGWFYLNVSDDAANALPLFERALELTTNDLCSATLGVAKCLSEMSDRQAAVGRLERIGLDIRERAVNLPIRQLQQEMNPSEDDGDV